jgi:hypothetical protein
MTPGIFVKVMQDFELMDPPDFVPMGPPAGAAFRPCGVRIRKV